MDLADYLRDWQLTDPRLLIETATSRIYTVQFADESVILKQLKPLGEEDESAGAMALDYFAGNGAVRLLRYDSGAHLLEFADGPDLLSLVDQDRDAAATAIIADVLNTLHQPRKSAPPSGLIPLRRWFRSLFNRAAGQDSIYRRAALVAGQLLDQPQDERVLHGDIHHQNIRYRAGRGWLAFDPKGLYGERTFDAANTLCNPIDRPALVEDEARFLVSAAILAERLQIERRRLLAYTFAYSALSASWTLDGGGSPDLALTVAHMVEKQL